MPKHAVKALHKAKIDNVEGEDSDKKDLVNALEIKILKAYQDYKRVHSHVTQKSPGIKVCRHVAVQVIFTC